MTSSDTCPPQYMAAVGILFKKWTPLILRPLMERPRRFSEIASYVPGLSDRLLSQRLQELEEFGVVERRVYDERPVRVQYLLTEKGRGLSTVLEEIGKWADRWETAPSAAE